MKQWRVGTITLGATLILTGFMWIYSQVAGIPIYDSVLKWWPLILIMLGIEILVFSIIPKNEEVTVRFSGVSIFLLVMLVLFLGTMQFVSRGFDYFKGHISIESYDNEITKEYEFSKDKLDTIIIRQSVGTVTLSEAPDEVIHIKVSVKHRKNNADYIEENLDNMFNSTDNKVFNVYSEAILDNNSITSIAYTISIPAGMDVEVYNKLGETNISNISGNVVVESFAGAVGLRDIQGNVRVQNKLGLVEAVNIKGDTFIESEGGAISYESEEVVKNNVNISNNLGTIELKLNEEQQGIFNCSTSLGAITSSLPLDIITKGAASFISGRIGDLDNTFIISTKSGTIEINN